MPGPPPKRSNQRRRRNKPDQPVTKAPAAKSFTPQKADSKWHPAARRWYEALAGSGQSAFYEPSDWATAWVIAEAMSRELSPQPVVADDGRITYVTFPPKGASLAAWLKAMTALMATEGDRRRARLELARPGPPEEGDADVSELDEYRRRLHGSA